MRTCFKINYVCEVGSGQNPNIRKSPDGALRKGKSEEWERKINASDSNLPVGSFRKQVGNN